MRLKIRIKETKRERRELTREERIIIGFCPQDATKIHPACRYISDIGYVSGSIIGGTAEFKTETIRDATDEEYYAFWVAQLPQRYTSIHGDDARLKYFHERDLGKIFLPELIP